MCATGAAIKTSATTKIGQLKAVGNNVLVASIPSCAMRSESAMNA